MICLILEGITCIEHSGLAALLSLAIAFPVQDAAAQDPVGGAMLGGAAGAILGGALGGGRGAAVGAVVGGTTGAVIGAQGQARPGGYDYYQNGCYIHRADGAWVCSRTQRTAIRPQLLSLLLLFPRRPPASCVTSWPIACWRCARTVRRMIGVPVSGSEF